MNNDKAEANTELIKSYIENVICHKDMRLAEIYVTLYSGYFMSVITRRTFEISHIDVSIFIVGLFM